MPSTGRGTGVGGAGAGVGGAGAGARRGGGLISSRAPEVEVVGAAARPEGGRGVGGGPSESGAAQVCPRLGRWWRGGGRRAQAGEVGEYPGHPASPARGSQGSGPARAGSGARAPDCGFPSRSGHLTDELSWGPCPRGFGASPPESAPVSGKAAVFRSRLTCLFRTVLPETVGLRVFYFYHFFLIF